MPQQRRQKKWQHMLSELKNGDKVVTSGGLRGTIVALRTTPASARAARQSGLEVTRASVVSRVSRGTTEQVIEVE